MTAPIDDDRPGFDGPDYDWRPTVYPVDPHDTPFDTGDYQPGEIPGTIRH